MPTVPTAFGSLVEPGWPSTLPGQPDLVGAFQSAAALKASINAKQQEFQAQMAHYALMEHSSKYDRDLAWKKYELDKRQVDLNYDVRLKGAETAATKAEIDSRRLVASIEDKERDDKWRQRKYDQASEAKDALLNLDDMIGKNPGDEGYPEALDQAARSVSDKLALLPNQVFNSFKEKRIKAHNQSAVSAWSQFHQDEKSISEDVSKSAFAGKLETDYGNILDYNHLDPETKTTGLGGWFGYGKKTKTDKLLVPQPGGGTLPVAVSELQRLKKRIQDSQERQKHLPQTVHLPEIGVYDIGEEPAPMDPAKREENKVYKLPKGKFRWANGQWSVP